MEKNVAFRVGHRRMVKGQEEEEEEKEEEEKRKRCLKKGRRRTRERGHLKEGE